MQDESTHEGRGLDVSEGGVLCEVYRAIPLSSTMSIDMKLPHTKRVHSFIADVVRVNGGNRKHHHVGVSFLRMQPYARQAISDYIRQELCLEGKEEPEKTTAISE